MGSLWGYMFTRTWKNARNKEYASLFMEAHGVHMANWHRFIEFNFSDQHAICLNSRNREFEGSVAQTIICWGIRGNCPSPQCAGLSMLCNMLGERSRTSLHLMILRNLPHTYFCTCFYSKEKQKWKQKGLYRFWTPGSLNFIQIKSEKCLEHHFFFENPGYLPAVLCLWSQARLWGFILQLLMLMRFPSSPPFMDLSLFKLQG